MLKSGVDSVLDRLFNEANLERLAQTPEPEQLNVRSTGLPEGGEVKPPQPNFPQESLALPPEVQEPPPPPPPPMTTETTPDLDTFTEDYFRSKGWGSFKEGLKRGFLSDPEYRKQRLEHGRHITEASDAYVKKYGEINRIRSGLANVTTTFVSPYFGKKMLLEQPEATTFEKIMAPVDIAAFAPFGLFAKGAKGIVGVAIKQAPNLDKLSASFKPIKEPVLKTGYGLYTKISKAFSDKFAVINEATGRVKKSMGGQIPDELNAEMWAALVPGAPEAAKQIVTDVLKSVKSSLVGIDPEYVNQYLKAQHNLDILKVHPDRKIAGGLTQENLTNALSEMRTRLGNDFKKVEDAAKIVTEHYNKLISDPDLVPKETSDMLKALYPHYNTLKYFEDLSESISTGKKMSVTSAYIGRLTKEGSELATLKPLDALPLVTLQREMLLARNKAAKSIIKMAEKDNILNKLIKRVSGVKPVAKVDEELIFRRPLGEIRGTISFMENGKRIVYEVPDYLEKAAKNLGSIPPNAFESAATEVNAISRLGFTSANLAFFIPNFAVDTLTAMITKGVSPLRVVKRLGLSLKDIIREDKILSDMRRTGIGMGGWWMKSPEQIAKELRKGGNIVLQNRYDAKKLINPLELIRRIGESVEMTPRSAIYETELKRGLTIPKAILSARRGTIDFSRSGTAVKSANYLYLYLNAGIQGSLLPFRALRDSTRSRIALSGYLAYMIGNYAWNRQFPEYKDVPNYAKYGANIFMLPSEEYDNRGNKVPHYIAVIPNLREWALFSAPIIYSLRKLDEKAPEDISLFLKDFLPGITPFGGITGQSGIAVPTQLGSTLTEISLNKDFFRDKPIIPPELEGKPPEEQYNQYTSETSRGLGKLLNQSPMKIDYFIKNTFGGLGSQILSAIDGVIGKLVPDDTTARIKDLYEQLQSIKAPDIAPEEVSRKRNEFLYNLSTEDRKQLLDLERKPEKQIPVITPIGRRLYRESGGQLYKTGQALSQKETGISPEQTRNAGKLLMEISDKLQNQQENLDAALLSGQIESKSWREARNLQSDIYTGALMAAGIQFPSSLQANTKPEVWNRYYDTIYTLASTIPDTRTRAQLLIAGWKTIKPIEIVPGEIDWDNFFRQREDFRNGLIPEDRNLLDSELKQRMTPVEKAYYDFNQEPKLREYYKLPEKTNARVLFRTAFPEIDAGLYLWGYVTTLKSDKAMQILIKKANEIGLDEKYLPYNKKEPMESEPSRVPTRRGKIKWAK